MTKGLQPASKLPREFYTRSNVLTVARELLGKLLVVPARDGKRISGIIVETEAYRGPQDRASHAYGGRRTKRTETMYEIGGTAYVYFVYGMYNQFNVVTNVNDIPHAVLIRALEPVDGVELMRKRRHDQPDHNLTNGPGKLCIAMGIDRTLDRADLVLASALIMRRSGSTDRGAFGSGTIHSLADARRVAAINFTRPFQTLILKRIHDQVARSRPPRLS